jgi:hypothetical protein
MENDFTSFDLWVLATPCCTVLAHMVWFVFLRKIPYPLSPDTPSAGFSPTCGLLPVVALVYVCTGWTWKLALVNPPPNQRAAIMYRRNSWMKNQKTHSQSTMSSAQ